MCFSSDSQLAHDRCASQDAEDLRAQLAKERATSADLQQQHQDQLLEQRETLRAAEAKHAALMRDATGRIAELQSEVQKVKEAGRSGAASAAESAAQQVRARPPLVSSQPFWLICILYRRPSWKWKSGSLTAWLPTRGN
jgi:hypothetical protein